MPLDQRKFIEDEIKAEEAEASKPSYTPPKTSTPTVWTPPDRQKPTKPWQQAGYWKTKQATVKANQSYTDIAKEYSVYPEWLVNAPGNPKNLRAGQVITVPQEELNAVTTKQPVVTPVPPAPQTNVPDLPGYGGTVADYRAAGANVTGQKDMAGYSAWMGRERESAEDNWYINNSAEIRSAYRSLSPLAKGPKADKIRADYQRLQEARKRTEVAGESPLNYFLGPNAADQSVGEWFTAGLSAQPDPVVQGPEDFAERMARNQMSTGQGLLDTLSNWWQELVGWNPDYEERPVETWGDVRAQQAMERRGQAMQDYYSSRPSGAGGPGSTAAQDQYPVGADQPYDPYRNPAYKDTGADQPGVYDIDYNGPNGTLHAPKGWVYYNGKAIRQDLFLDYLNNLDHGTTEDNPEYWQRQIFVRGAAKDMEAIMWALDRQDRDMLPTAITPGHLELMGTSRTPAEWAAYMRDVLNYRWDEATGVWVKQASGGTGFGADSTGGGKPGYAGKPRRGGGGGGRGGVGSSRGPQLTSYGRGKGGTHTGFDRQGRALGPGNAPVHWRI